MQNSKYREEDFVSRADLQEDRFEFTFDKLVNEKIAAVRDKYVRKADQYRKQRDFHKLSVDELQTQNTKLKAKFSSMYDTLTETKEDNMKKEKQLTRTKLKLREFEINYAKDLQEWHEIAEGFERRLHNERDRYMEVSVRYKDLYKDVSELREFTQNKISMLTGKDKITLFRRVSLWRFLWMKIKLLFKRKNPYL